MNAAEQNLNQPFGYLPLYKAFLIKDSLNSTTKVCMGLPYKKKKMNEGKNLISLLRGFSFSESWFFDAWFFEQFSKTFNYVF